MTVCYSENKLMKLVQFFCKIKSHVLAKMKREFSNETQVKYFFCIILNASCKTKKSLANNTDYNNFLRKIAIHLTNFIVENSGDMYYT